MVVQVQEVSKLLNSMEGVGQKKIKIPEGGITKTYLGFQGVLAKIELNSRRDHKAKGSLQ